MRTTRSTWAALVAIGSLACGGAALIVVLAGCPNTASTSIYTPPTGIQIDSQNLVEGIGCGPGPGQVYRYAAVIGDPEKDGGVGIAMGTTPITSGVFDCFSDALFANLAQPDGGPTDYGIDIYAYDRASFPAELGGCENLPLNVSCPGDDASVVRHYAAQATWTTHCRDTQTQGVPQFANCDPLEPAPVEGGMQSDAGDATTSGDASGEASDAPADTPAEVADAPTAEASDGPGVSGEGGDAPLE